MLELLGFIGFLVVGGLLVNDLEKLCPHGVRGGKVQNLCAICVQEQKAIEERHRLEQELLERQRRLTAAADELQRSEASRLESMLNDSKLSFSIDQLRSMSPWDFEDIVARMFERMGFTVQQTPKVKDGGRDAILTKDGKKFLECKRYKDGSVSGEPQLRGLHSVMTTDRADGGYFVTAGGFSKDAIAFSKTVNIKLVDQCELTRMMLECSPDATKVDTYKVMCRTCGEIVNHRLTSKLDVKCCSRHRVAPTSSVEQIFAAIRRAKKRTAIKGVSSEFFAPTGLSPDFSAATAEKPKQPGDCAIAVGAMGANPKEAIALLNRGNAYAQKGQYDRAIADYNEAIRLNPKDANALHSRGNAYAQTGAYNYAIPDYDEAIQLDPKNAFAFFNRGNAYMEKGQYDRAIADFDEAIRLDPQNVSALCNRANLYFKKGEYDRAIEDYDEVIFYNSGIEDKDYDEAIWADREGDALLFYRRGLAYSHKKRYEWAIADYDEAIRLDPKNAFAFFNRGNAYMEKGQYDRAIADFDEAIKLNPNFAEAIKRRAEAVAKKMLAEQWNLAE
jgi:tetratricopeptide (TPR) repeat protein